MRHIIFVTVIVLATISGLMAQSNDMVTGFKIGVTTKGYEVFSSVLNGRAWQTMDMERHIAYIHGIREGLELAKREGLNWEYLYAPTGFLFSELAKQIDIFYSDSANLRIPVLEAYIYTKRKLRGDSPKELADFEALLRRTYNK